MENDDDAREALLRYLQEVAQGESKSEARYAAELADLRIQQCSQLFLKAINQSPGGKRPCLPWRMLPPIL